MTPELELIQAIFEEAAPFVREQYGRRGSLEVSTKSHVNDMLTEADLAVQQKIVNGIRGEFPDDAILAEEAGMNRLPSDLQGRFWIIDPIDGTQNFVRGMFPAFGISLAFMADGALQAAGIAVPSRDDIYLAARGHGTTRNGYPVRTGPAATLEQSRVEVDFCSQEFRAPTLENFGGLICAAGQVRTHAAASIGLASIVSGDMDAYVHVDLNLWDYAAGVLLVEEAGGRATQLDGSPLALLDPSSPIVATNGDIHDELLEVIREYRKQGSTV